MKCDNVLSVEMKNLLNPNLKMLKHKKGKNKLQTSYGIHYKFKTDKRTVFEYKRKGASRLEEDTFLQFPYAFHQLGIQL